MVMREPKGPPVRPNNKQPLAYRDYYVYAMLCQDGKGSPGYVKFGFSGRIGDRLSQLKSGCPIPAKYFLVYPVGALERTARQLERALHRRFKDRRIRGEWFRFDFESPEDKRDFTRGCNESLREVFREVREKWTPISVKALEESERQRRAWFLNSKWGKRAKRRQRQETHKRHTYGDAA